MGAATWAAVLAEQGKCPFTQNPLRRDQVTSCLLPAIAALWTFCMHGPVLCLMRWLLMSTLDCRSVE
jgi:hypothetical protein